VRAGPGRVLAVLDTSFWVAAYRAEVAANCLDLFEIVVPHAVEAEIRSVQVVAPRSSGICAGSCGIRRPRHRRPCRGSDPARRRPSR
jgi:hypothetical protein